MPTSKILEATENFLSEIGNRLSRFDLSTSLEELLGNYSTVIDKIILREEHEKNCSYIGGEFKIICADDEKYFCAYSLYFEDADESIHTLEAQSKPLEMKFLTENFRRALQKSGVLKFELDEPAQEVQQQ